MYPNMSSRIETIYEQKSSIKKAKNKVNALRHRLSDAKWRINLNNGFNALKSIIGSNNTTNKKGKSLHLSRIQVLESIIDFIKDKELIINELVNKRAIMCQSDNIVDISLDQIKNVFDLLERKQSINTLKVFNDNKSNEINVKQMKSSHIKDIPKNERIDENNKYNEILDKNELNSISNNNSYIVLEPLVEPVIKYSEQNDICIDININNSNNEYYYYLSGESNNSYHSYETYSVQLPQESDSFKAYFDRRVERNECLTTDLVEYLSNNLPLSTMSSFAHSIDSSFDSSAGSHYDDCYCPLTPNNIAKDIIESMNRKKKCLSFSPESRPINCRRKLEWNQDSNEWPGIMNLNIEEKGSANGINVIKTDLNQQFVKLNKDQCFGDNANVGQLSKDLESIEIQNLCINNLNLSESQMSFSCFQPFIN